MANTMELMRELKHLSELRKAGQLNADGEARLQAIRTVLDQQMGSRSSSAPKAAPAARPAAAPPSAEKKPLRYDEVAPGDPNAFKLDIPDELAADVEAANARADAALKASKTRPQPRNADEAVQQLVEITRESAYTPPEISLQASDYFGYEQYEAMPDAVIELPLIDPRTEEMRQAQAAMHSGGDGQSVPTAMPGGVFLDDFLELYTTGILSAQDFDDVGEEDITDPTLLIPGKRKVTVHMASGEVKRGLIDRMSRNDLGFTLLPQGPGRPEMISLQQIKAIFISLNPGKEPPSPTGKAVTVTFKDRRAIQGATSDYGIGQTFTLVPTNARGGFELIIVNQAQVLDVR